MYILAEEHHVNVYRDNGMLMSTISVPEKIQQAYLQSEDVISITTDKSVMIYKRMRNSQIFSLYRRRGL